MKTKKSKGENGAAAKDHGSENPGLYLGMQGNGQNEIKQGYPENDNGQMPGERIPTARSH